MSEVKKIITKLESSDEYNLNVSNCVTEDNIGSDLIVAVMTICGDIGCPINLLKIFDLYINGKCGNDFELNYVPNSKKSKDGKKNKAFYNCLSVLYYFKDSNGIESKIAAKVFPNGSVQLPGCRTIEAVSKAPEVLFNFIMKFKPIDDNIRPSFEKQVQETLVDRTQVFGACERYQKQMLTDANEFIANQMIIKYPNDFQLQNIRIVMINSNFVFQHQVEDSPDVFKIEQVGINQERLKNIINENKFEGKEEPGRQWRMATYQPEKYAGVNIRYWTEKAQKKYAHYFMEGRKLPKKIEGQISIFVFRSGKGTITAAKNSKDLLEAYQAICKLVRENSQDLFYNPTITGKKPLAVITGKHRGQTIDLNKISDIPVGSRISCKKGFLENVKTVIKVKNVTNTGGKSYFTIST